ncbi:MAG: S41 family peptidase [Bacteroidales bacterium]|jgi:Tol biopolymer transport system component/C-terminal processing protease CtpA/Prc|nr:S41 family peptidase [Bacteroidales bacterium]
MKKLLTLFLFILQVSVLFAQENPLWMRYTAISPDGKTILFCYKGDLWSVPSTGGTAIPLTLTESYEYSPVWSHDGKTIAFASDRNGNFDVFVMAAKGGEARRLTFHSNREIPWSFTANNKDVIFSAYRQDLATQAQFPISMMGELYTVPVSGGKASMLLPTPALQVCPTATGDKIIFEDIKGYESEWRKHHTSAITRDIWLYDFNSKKYTRLTQFNGEDRNPVFDADNQTFYYLSEQNGSFNVFKSSISDPSKTTALTHFTKNPVRFLSRSDQNTLCFTYDGEIYTLRPGEDPVKIPVTILADGRSAQERIVPVNEGFTELRLSSNGKEYAYVFHGEIFVSSIDGGFTKRITNTPYQERSVSFSPDGRSLVYAAEVNNSWNVYTTSIVRKEEPYFYASTVLKTEPLVATEAEEFQPEYSPDGKEVAYLENRVVLKVINLASGKTRTIMPANVNYSYSDGDQYYQWSPDSKWFLVNFAFPDRIFSPEVGLVSADGNGKIQNLTLSGYDDYVPKWSVDGKMMIWGCNREGDRQQGGNLSSSDVYAMFFTKAAFDRFRLSKEELALVKDQEEKEKKEKKKTEEKSKPEQEKKSKIDTSEKTKADSVKVTIDLDNLTERKIKLTINTSPVRDWLLSKDGEKLFYLTSFEKDNDLWVTELRTKETKLLAKLGLKRPGMELSSDGKFILLFADGKPIKVEVEGGKAEPLKTNGEMLLKPALERNYIFDHCWRQFKEKFYVEDMQGVDWNYYYTVYKKFLPYINNNYDFAEMLSEMLGEMNASHTGCGYNAGKPNVDQTADLGLFFDYDYRGAGLKIAGVVEGGPVDKATSRLKSGCILEKIDGEALNDSLDFYTLLNRKTGKLTLLSVYNPANGERWDESVKPVTLGEASELLYKRWVKNRRNEVDSLSGGKIGYVHVRSMDDASMRVVFEEALGRNFEKNALIVDTRFNGGGNIHEQLSDFLSGKKYMDIVPHGQYIGSEPYDKWTKPSIVLIGECNYSDAHLFPVAYKLKNIGKTLGMPVPGTGTFVWWENQIDPTLVYGIPMGGWRTPDGKFCENNQMEPDVRVPNDPGILSSGRDQQIEAAVKELMK